MSDIKVEFYAGYKGDQLPLRFTVREQTLEVIEVEDQWYSPSSEYFRVRAGDGNIYVLHHDLEPDRWSVDAFRRK